MKATFRLSMTWLHTWVGLLLGWVAYAVFLTGTASYFRPEITRWMRPELTAHAPVRATAAAATRTLSERAADAPRWLIDLPDDRSAELRAYWQPKGGGRFRSVALDATSGGEETARASYGGEFFYRFHFQLLLPHPWGRYTAGLVAMAMFIALITGVIAHRRFFADLFLLRFGRAPLRSWLDVHNLAGTLALPFCLMITYSALIIFATLYLPWPGKVLGPAPAAERATPSAVASGWVEPASLEPMLAAARERWGDQRSIKRIEVADRGTPQALVTFTRADGDETISLRQREQLRFDGVTGALLDSTPSGAGDGIGRRVNGVLYGLHLARFAGPLLRGLLFALGLLGTTLIASGVVVWVLKRQPKLAAAGAGARAGAWLVERLNLTFLAGLPLACVGFFWANRLLPVGLTERANREVHVFLLVWGAALLHALLRRPARAWSEQLAAGGALCVLLPLVDAITAGRHLAAALRSIDAVYLGFEAMVVALGVCLLLAARRRGRENRPAAVTQPQRDDALTALEARP